MKIAVWHNLPSGGGKRALYYHVRGLVERGHTVEVWCPPTADQSYLPLSNLVPEHVVSLGVRPKRRGIARALATPRLPLGRLLGYYHQTVNRLIEMDLHCRACAEQINAGGFDVLFANSCLFHRAPAIGRYVVLPKALYLQEPYRALYEALPVLPWLAPADPEMGRLSGAYLKGYLGDLAKTQGLRMQVREELVNAQAYDSLLVNSFFSRESLLRAYGLNAAVCYLGVDTELFTDRRLLRERFVIGLGSFTIEKNIPLVIEALARMPVPRPKLVWVGNASATLHLELSRLAESLGVCFEPLVRVTDEELVGLLNQASAMVYAPRLEPFGFAPLEANACGTPVVAVAEGGVRETVADGVNGLLVDHDPQALADALGRLLSDPAYARRLGENGRRLVAKKWSLPASIDRLEAQLHRVIQGVGKDRVA